MTHTRRRKTAGREALGLWIAGLVMAVLLLAAAPARAQEESPAVPQAVEQKQEKMSIAELLDDESFHYNSASRRDPFKSLLTLQAKKKDISLLPPVQQLDLGQIKITGIVLDETEGPRAMIKAPNGRTFIITKGTIVGKNEGEVIEVNLQGFRVVERYVDFMGRETLKELFIKARPDKK
jgi:type IV pilus assembly protein PilP